MTLTHQLNRHWFAIAVFILLIIPVYVGIQSRLFYERQQTPKDIREVRKLKLNDHGRYRDMIQAYERLSKKYPLRNELNYNLAWAYYKNGNRELAQYYINEYRTNNPLYPSWQDPYVKKMLRFSS